MPKRSAGLILYRAGSAGIEVLLVHPGGPFWARRDAGAWSIPKGEHDDSETPLATALREFTEETGWPAPGTETLLDLGEIRQKSGKRVRAFAVRGDADPETVRSNTITIEWPPRSGRPMNVPEIDRAGWFGLDEAATRLIEAQRPLLDRLSAALAAQAITPAAERPVPRPDGTP